MTNNQYQPKGGMCCVCNRKNANCSSLEFKNMRIIEHHDHIKIVKCENFTKTNCNLDK